MDFNVDLSIFRGPLDLLLYLVRKQEVEIVDIPISLITDQYLEYLGVLQELDIGAVGDFLALASMLIEIKSQQVLPRADEVEEDGRLRIAQVSRSGCELILSDQWPDEAGRGLLFISLARADLTGSHLKLRTGASN